ncbi:hypothetical protein L7F22_017378 [Adiantum nelumboides]|nr:hypothetical protein [Adiantum nelumboides]
MEMMKVDMFQLREKEVIKTLIKKEVEVIEIEIETLIEIVMEEEAILMMEEEEETEIERGGIEKFRDRDGRTRSRSPNNRDLPYDKTPTGPRFSARYPVVDSRSSFGDSRNHQDGQAGVGASRHVQRNSNDSPPRKLLKRKEDPPAEARERLKSLGETPVGSLKDSTSFSNPDSKATTSESSTNAGGDQDLQRIPNRTQGDEGEAMEIDSGAEDSTNVNSNPIPTGPSAQNSFGGYDQSRANGSSSSYQHSSNGSGRSFPQQTNGFGSVPPTGPSNKWQQSQSGSRPFYHGPPPPSSSTTQSGFAAPGGLQNQPPGPPPIHALPAPSAPATQVPPVSILNPNLPPIQRYPPSSIIVSPNSKPRMKPRPSDFIPGPIRRKNRLQPLPLNQREFWGCSKFSDYELGKKLGQGSYHWKTGEMYMVEPYMDHDLNGMLENPNIQLQNNQIKLYMKQLLEGTLYMHKNKVLHRDMKAANLLINNEGQLQIADFGLARPYYDPGEAWKSKGWKGGMVPYTAMVVTRWYRPPELLAGEKKYGPPIDMWGLGCILAEMVSKSPIFKGSSEINQMQLIANLCGSPNEHNYPGWNALPGVKNADPNGLPDKNPEIPGEKNFGNQVRQVKQSFMNPAGLSINPQCADLIDKLLVLDPRQRLTAEEALEHPYFWTRPYPADPASLPKYEASKELDKIDRNRQHHQAQQQQQQHQQPNPSYNSGGPAHPQMRGSSNQRIPHIGFNQPQQTYGGGGSGFQSSSQNRHQPPPQNSYQYNGPPPPTSNPNPPVPWECKEESQPASSWIKSPQISSLKYSDTPRLWIWAYCHRSAFKIIKTFAERSNHTLVSVKTREEFSKEEWKQVMPLLERSKATLRSPWSQDELNKISSLQTLAVSGQTDGAASVMMKKKRRKRKAGDTNFSDLLNCSLSHLVALQVSTTAIKHLGLFNNLRNLTLFLEFDYAEPDLHFNQHAEDVKEVIQFCSKHASTLNWIQFSQFASEPTFDIDEVLKNLDLDSDSTVHYPSLTDLYFSKDQIYSPQLLARVVFSRNFEARKSLKDGNRTCLELTVHLHPAHIDDFCDAEEKVISDFIEKTIEMAGRTTVGRME